MISALYASLSAFIIVWLSLNVIKNRRKYKISAGDGGNKELETARAAHSNAIEYIPIILLMLFSLEYNQANLIIVHLFGITLITGRLIHARAIILANLKRRILGMKITLFTILGLAIVNIIYCNYSAPSKGRLS